MMPSRCSINATSRCSGSSCGLLCSRASSRAAATASRAFSVYLLMFMIGSQPTALCGAMRRAFLQFLQGFKVLPLLGRQRLRQLHVHGGVEIPVFARFAGHRHAVSLQAENLAVLGV